ncbi:MAG: phosphatase PAP2 family protein [Candidatus Zixiibacteriota bacterium]|nr:MAG: phosphatase PAP2 family protein [candidate division Zixibacteria bacterium]
MTVTAAPTARVLKTGGLYLYDRLVIGYCLLMLALLLAIGRPIGEYIDEIVFYASAAAAAALIIRYVNEEKNIVSRFLRLFYPALLFTFFYRETGGMMFLVFDGFYDWQLTAFEKTVFGAYPTILIDRHLLNVWINELLSLCYFSYYFMIPVFLLVFFIRKEYGLIKSFMAATCLTFFVSYLLFFLYPIEGPRWHFAGQYVNGIEGPVFRRLAEFVISNAAVRGGCMPSSHFGVALVILMYTFRYRSGSGWWLLPAVVGLGLGTVWGRYHYVSDVVAGGLIGLASVLIVWKYCGIGVTQEYNNAKTEELTTKNVP